MAISVSVAVTPAIFLILEISSMAHGSNSGIQGFRDLGIEGILSLLPLSLHPIP
jgi:hypothetical protein